jgi:hypothetical protein
MLSPVILSTVHTVIPRGISLLFVVSRAEVLLPLGDRFMLPSLDDSCSNCAIAEVETSVAMHNIIIFFSIYL